MRPWRVAESLQVLLDEINDTAVERSRADDGAIGDEAHGHRRSDHNPCVCHKVVCARDFTHDPEGGFDCEEFVSWLILRMRNGAEKRVKYIIWNKKIYSDLGFGRPYAGPNPHDKHCHISVKHGPELFDDKSEWGWLKAYEAAYKKPKICPTCGQVIEQF